MECEMCGSSTGTRRYMVDGTVMNLGACCGKYGTALDQPAQQGSKAAVQQNLERRAGRQQRNDVFTQSEQWDLADDFPKRIREGRERKGVSKEDLGSKVHARVPELNKFESGQLRPSDQQARALERELGISLMEKVEAGAAKVGGVATGKATGLTLGDMLKDAMKKK